MNRALALSRRGMGTVKPNPPVGAVVVGDEKIVGAGFHVRAGEDHAEIVALRKAGTQARGSTLYVTLEPCNHQGRTPPCVPAIIKAGVRRVHFSAPDPSPHSGSGTQALKDAGIEVVHGPGKREAAHLLAGFYSLQERNRPRFFLKVATSMDGRIAAGKGDSRWISSGIARAWVHRRRREADAILVGSGTAIHDNPSLTTRAVKGHSPDRMVVDSSLTVSPKSRVWNADGVRRVAATTDRATPERKDVLEAKGVEVWTFPADADGRVPLRELAKKMGDEGYTNVLVEGGGSLSGALFQSHLVDVAWVVIAHHLLLGGDGPGWTQGLHVDAVPRAVKLRRSSFRSLGPDWLITLVPEAAQWWDPETAHV